ncbi:hypothetical protein WJ511_21635 [Ralstonia solanacearum]|uniref:Uncharacterized protein n=2 Tax=Ralstonia TaxID=48736 RepID=A0A7U7PQ49_RALSL|nr:hypothetical protein [Ralstonia solanacearum]CEJ16607.1 conserved hypothetical protein [Ralstonia solanacearum IPO1609]ALF90999.1 hypothetical protein RSUY_46970 [Ralstonia solanacearum]ATI30409.1 hypothetical protein CCY86_23640 [Ralstonia solanacearum]ATJ89148.1 hypothetical protein CDC59_23520 [Ralstonia solanacearum]KEI32493.1 hypothetical protein CQ06_16500 [Ralstonia solanacearum]
MSRLGIEYQNGLIYEGRDNPSSLAVPTPIISQCTLIESPSDLERLPRGIDSDPFRWIFREDSFDPVSRVRRGRLFQPFSNSNKELVSVDAHPFLPSDLGRRGVDGQLRKEMTVFIHCTQLVVRRERGEGLQLAIGHEGAHSLWRILQTEQTVTQDVLVTLRAESVFGVLPPLDLAQIPEDGRTAVAAAYDRVMHVAYRDSPTSVVDQCRNLCAVLMARWLRQRTSNDRLLHDDLGACISAVKKFAEGEHQLVRAALETVNRLHPRGKENERERYSLREVSNEDAELALHATGFVIRELGWGR